VLLMMFLAHWTWAVFCIILVRLFDVLVWLFVELVRLFVTLTCTWFAMTVLFVAMILFWVAMTLIWVVWVCTIDRGSWMTLRGVHGGCLHGYFCVGLSMISAFCHLSIDRSPLVFIVCQLIVTCPVILYFICQKLFIYGPVTTSTDHYGLYCTGLVTISNIIWIGSKGKI
jgi:hypothetical protein